MRRIRSSRRKKTLRRGRRIVVGAVVVGQVHAKVCADGVELVVWQVVRKVAREHQRIGVRAVERDAAAPAVIADEAHVKAGVVRHQAAALRKGGKIPQHVARGRRAGDHVVRDAGELCDCPTE